ncbi:MAG: hypothetical protein PHT33_12235, partial [bacterium]|nr:hypothetical protein [bacterium]
MKRRFHSLLILFFLLLITAFSSIAEAAGGTVGKNISSIPTIVLLAGSEHGLDKSPSFSLLERNLLQDKKIKLLELNQIDLVFKEQELSLMLSPEGGSSRVKAGRLLKADLLVLLKAVERNG